MRFGIFYEHQMPRPWPEDAEEKLLNDALEQVELADKIGIDYVWEVEHHFLEEYSHSSAPEVFLAAASQRTNRIRLVRWLHAARNTSGADEWLYSSRKWCSTSHTYWMPSESASST